MRASTSPSTPRRRTTGVTLAARPAAARYGSATGVGAQGDEEVSTHEARHRDHQAVQARRRQDGAGDVRRPRHDGRPRRPATAASAATPRSTAARSTPSTWCRRCGSRSWSTTPTPTTWSTSSSRRRQTGRIGDGKVWSMPGRRRRPGTHRRAWAGRALAPPARVTLEVTGSPSERAAAAGPARTLRAGPAARARRPRPTPGSPGSSTRPAATRPGAPWSRSAATAAASCPRAATWTWSCSVPGSATPAAAAQVADRLWYPIWDAGIQLDHSVRTAAEARRVAADDLRALLGDARPAARRRRRGAERDAARGRSWPTGVGFAPAPAARAARPASAGRADARPATSPSRSSPT